MITDLYLVDSDGRVGGISLSFVPLLLFLLLGFIRRLGILGESFNLGFVPAIIFHRSLSLDFMCGNIYRSDSSENLMIGFLYISIRS